MQGDTRSLSGDPLLRLIDHIYEGTVDPDAWPAIVEHFSRFFQSAKARLFTGFVAPEKGGLGISHGIPETSLRQWAARYIEHDIWLQAAVRKDLFREGYAVLDADLVPEEEFVQSVIYREHLEGLGIARLCSGVVFDTQSPGVLPALIVTYRSLAELHYTEDDRRRMKTLIPHLSRALGVMFRLRDAELKAAASLSALDRLESGVALIDGAGAVVHVNREAQRLLDEDDGLALKDAPRAGRRLAASELAVQAHIERAITGATSTDVVEAPHFSTSITVPRPSGRRPFVLQFAPLPRGNDFSKRTGFAAGIVFVTDPDRHAVLDEDVLRHIYRVTPTEARLAGLLHAGHTLESSAEKLQISRETARTHLSELFRKTGTARQSDLARLLVSLNSRRV